MKSICAIGIVLISVVTPCGARDLRVPTSSAFASDWNRSRFDHGLLDGVLVDHVNASGHVDYAAIREDTRFNEYLYRLSETDPAALPDDNARLAFWINAYNALVIQGVLETLPDDRDGWSSFNVLEVDVPGFAEPGKSFFRGLKFSVGGRRYALDEIEHGVLLQRKEWVEKNPRHYRSVGAGTPDPRIHFALVCAAKGCVKLKRGAYTASAVDRQLGQAVRGFVQDKDRIRISRGRRTIHLTKLLDWYGGDLTDTAFEPHAGSVPAFLARYVSDDALARSLRSDKWTIEWIDYDWTLNLQR